MQYHFFYPTQITLADVDVACTLTILVEGFKFNMDNFPKLKAMQNKVFSERLPGSKPPTDPNGKTAEGL